MQEMNNIETILEPYAGRGRDALLPLLWDVQTRQGCIDADAVHHISHTLRVPEADIYGVISFYSLYASEPSAETVIRVCTDPSCGLKAADQLIEKLNNAEQHKGENGASNGQYMVEHSPCLGLCELAPAALVTRRGLGEVSIGNATEDSLFKPDMPSYNSIAITTTNVLLPGTEAIALGSESGWKADNRSSLEAFGEYRALRTVLDSRTPEEVISEVEASSLIGRGGAAFPTGLKWKFTRGAAGSEKYLVCNADESEPGTFKDRVLMEMNPHLILQGMAIAAYAIGAEKGYLFIRGEYPAAQKIMQDAIETAVNANLLGDRILGSDFSFHIEIRRGAGAYICGEETALFEAIEGKRGFPRIKPPYPTTHGLFQKPTTVNNVETLASVPSIIERGAEWFRSLGTESSTGSKLVSVSGHVNRPGVYEIQPGIALRTLLEEYCQGIDGDLQAILMGGAAGTFLTPEDLDVPLTFEDLRAIGSTFGSGAIMVFNQMVDMQDVLRRLAVFFAHESCGKCFPCQLGTQRQVEILKQDHFFEGDFVRLQDIGLTMTESSLCGLGQTAASAVLSAMSQWPTLFAEGE